MTGIAGIAGIADPRSGRVYIGGDSAGTGSSQQIIRSDSKVFFNGACLFGCTSSFRMLQLLRYSLEIPPYESSVSIAHVRHEVAPMSVSTTKVVMRLTVSPVVSYQDMRSWQRDGVKLLGQ